MSRRFYRKGAQTPLERAREHERRAWQLLLSFLPLILLTGWLLHGIHFQQRQGESCTSRLPQPFYTPEEAQDDKPEPIELPETVNHEIAPAETLICQDVAIEELPDLVELPEEFEETPILALSPALPDSLETEKPAPEKESRPAQPAKKAVAASTPQRSSEILPPSYKTTPKPPYPAALRASRTTGSVRVRISIDSDGIPTQVTVIQSSGYSEFDSAARSWIIKKWRFNPARIKESSQAIAGTVVTTIHFKLS